MMHAQGTSIEDSDDGLDLENPEDIKLINNEFMEIYNADKEFRESFGESAHELPPYHKYQIIDVYNHRGMEGVYMLMLERTKQ